MLANPALGQLNREVFPPLFPFAADLSFSTLELNLVLTTVGAHSGNSMDQTLGQLNRENEYQNSVFPCPRSRLRIWFHETGSAIPSRVSLLIFHTQAESGAYSRDSSRFPRRCPFIYIALRHRASPEFIRSRNCVPTAITAEASSPQRSSSNGCCLFRFSHGTN